MSKRLEFLLKTTANPAADAFAWYALALEYKNLGRVPDALDTFTQLRAREPDYVPMYLMCGTMLIEAHQLADAREWLGAGLEVARRKGDTHAAGEIEGALGPISMD